MQDTETHSTHTNAHIHSQIPTHTHTHARISPLAFPHSHLENKETCRANLQPQKKNTLGKDTKEIGKTRRNRAKDQVIESKDMAQQERGRREWRLFWNGDTCVLGQNSPQKQRAAEKKLRCSQNCARWLSLSLSLFSLMASLPLKCLKIKILAEAP